MSKPFASQADLTPKKATFAKLAEGVYAYTTEGDPNVGVIVGDDACMVVDARATPVLAQEFIAEIRKVTDLPIRYVTLTHYHAVRTLGASAYGAEFVIASEGTLELIRERGEADFKSEVQRFPRLFQAVETVLGLTVPNLVFRDRLTLWLGKREVQVLHLGNGHTQGDTVVWLPAERVLFSGDLVETGATPYTGDAYLGDWVKTLDRVRDLRPGEALPGRGEALINASACASAIDQTQLFLKMLQTLVQEGIVKGQSLKEIFNATREALRPRFGNWVIFEHCLPFNVSRAYDELRGIVHPRVWTESRDREIWQALQG